MLPGGHLVRLGGHLIRLGGHFILLGGHVGGHLFNKTGRSFNKPGRSLCTAGRSFSYCSGRSFHVAGRSFSKTGRSFKCTKRQKMMSKSDYNSYLAVNEVKGRSPAEVGTDYEASYRKWYHLLFNEEDFSLLIAVPNIKWYVICLCHLVADDGSTAHEHMHALIHFVNNSTHLVSSHIAFSLSPIDNKGWVKSV